ncbi:MAG: hypothetical protein ACYSO4_07090 [Planctomycetota bacterium]|jgi:hypothetical protein
MKKRQRLSSKQIAFFKNVFLANMPVSDALNNLNIRLTTFDRWLTKPIFLERLQLHINHFYHEARLELARTTPRAVSGLNFLSEKTLRHKEVRQACNDLLNFHTKLAKLSSSQGGLPQRAEGLKQVTNGSVLDNNGAVLAQFGAFLDNKGAAKDKLGNTNTPKNITYNPKNED